MHLTDAHKQFLSRVDPCFVLGERVSCNSVYMKRVRKVCSSILLWVRNRVCLELVKENWFVNFVPDKMSQKQNFLISDMEILP